MIGIRKAYPMNKRVQYENVCPFDVDDTLVMWEFQRTEVVDTIEVRDPYKPDEVQTLKPNWPMIELLKTKRARGEYIIVWSQGGEKWANAVIEALDLQNYVHQTMTKPRSYADDLPCQEWMGERVYLKPDSKWRNNA